RDALKKELADLKAAAAKKAPPPATNISKTDEDQIKQLTAQLEAARAKGDTKTAMDLSSRLNTLKEKYGKSESGELRKDPAYAKTQDELKKTETELEQLNKSITKARDWREKLVSTLAATFHMPTPLQEGRQGLLGRVSVVKIIDSQTAIINFRAE